MGRLIYLMGASGVGKDSLLKAVRHQQPDWLVAHRYLTRASGAHEQCVTLSDTEFAVRRELEVLCLEWQAHGLHYGIGVEIEAWLARGATVLLNGSRRALPQARQRFGATLVPVLITASTEVLRQRLTQRGRESCDDIERRLERHQEVQAELMGACADVASIDNGGALAESLAALSDIIEGHGATLA